MLNCKLHGIEFNKQDTGNKWRCVKCSSLRTQRYRRNNKLKAIEYKGGECQMCGYKKCVSALEFHHLDPKEKEFSLSFKGKNKSWEKILIELSKCILLCANCHREVHETWNKMGVYSSGDENPLSTD